MKIDGHPFPTNAFDVGTLEIGNKAPKSDHTDGSAASESKVSAKSTTHRGRYEEGEGSIRLCKVVTSRMLLNKYRRQQERERRRQEERHRCELEHRRCPFFTFCWDKGMRLPSADDCLECRGMRVDYQEIKRQQCDSGDHRPSVGNRRGRGCISVHEHLGARVERPRSKSRPMRGYLMKHHWISRWNAMMIHR